MWQSREQCGVDVAFTLCCDTTCFAPVPVMTGIFAMAAHCLRLSSAYFSLWSMRCNAKPETHEHSK